MSNWTQVLSDTQRICLDTPGTLSAVYLSNTVVPSTAKEVLVYVYIRTGYVVSGSGTVQIYTTTANVLKLHVYTYHQSAVSYNSDNIWLPIGEGRVVYGKYTGSAITKNSYAGFQIVGYR